MAVEMAEMTVAEMVAEMVAMMVDGMVVKKVA